MDTNHTPPLIHELGFDVATEDNAAVCLCFHKIPLLALKHVGQIRIDWGDGNSDMPYCVLNDTELQQMISGQLDVALLKIYHRYTIAGTRTIRVFTTSGFLPLYRLPYQTIAIRTALPTLTIGELTDKNTLLGSDTLPRLVCDAPNGKSMLQSVPDNLLIANTQIEYFDEAFLRTQICQISPNFFSYNKTLTSLIRTFSEAPITTIPEGLLSHATENTDVTEMFYACPALQHASNPFGLQLPKLHHDFLGKTHLHFAWVKGRIRNEMGWVRPDAVLSNSAFSFVWSPSSNSARETVLHFFPTGSDFRGNILIDWGDDTLERIDWHQTKDVTHIFVNKVPHTIQIHYTDNESVCPFALGQRVVEYLTPLPHFHRQLSFEVREFHSWAANQRLLKSIPKHFFDANPEIVTLDQAFAGCLQLTTVPDDVISELKQLKNADSMFAYCKSLDHLPESYRQFKRNQALDCFTEHSLDNEDTEK